MASTHHSKIRVRWVRHVAHTGERRHAYRIWWGNLREKDHMEDPGIDGKIMFRKWDGATWTGLIWLRIGTGDGLL
jgi:hypothetical protein